MSDDLKAIFLTKKEQIAMKTLAEMYLSKIDEKADMTNPVMIEVKKSLSSAKEKL